MNQTNLRPDSVSPSYTTGCVTVVWLREFFDLPTIHKLYRPTGTETE
jgi:hypothetical protein